MKTVKEEKELSVKEQCDVLVVGAGVAGVAAAVAASREGANVILAEREYVLGGLATMGIIAIYLPLCDGMGKQMIGGISEELLKLSIKYGSGEIPDCWKSDDDQEARKKQRYKLRFDPPAFAYALDRFIVENNVKLKLGTALSNVIMDKGSIQYCIFDDKNERFAIEAKMVIDATGDAIVSKLANEDWKVFHKNRLAGWYYSLDSNSEYKLNIVQEKLKIPESEVSKFYDGITDTTQFCLDSREMTFKHVKESNPRPIVTQISTIPEIRMGRRLKGNYELKEEDVYKHFKDEVGCFGDWRKAGPKYALPFSSLVGKCKNLMVAGRCISSDEETGDIVRAIPVCALSGEVAGTASAIHVRNNECDIHDIDISDLKEILIKNNNIIDL